MWSTYLSDLYTHLILDQSKQQKTKKTKTKQKFEIVLPHCWKWRRLAVVIRNNDQIIEFYTQQMMNIQHKRSRVSITSVNIDQQQQSQNGVRHHLQQQIQQKQQQHQYKWNRKWSEILFRVGGPTCDQQWIIHEWMNNENR